MNFIL